MAAPYAAPSGPSGNWQPEMRSITPATDNTRHIAGRYASAPRMGGSPGMPRHPDEPYASNRSLTPSRYMSGYDRGGEQAVATASDSGVDPRGTPSSTGLIRLSLKKPMGIVFEPMYDPNQKTLQRGVRICDLPRTGAAALSRKLQVGDELLQINDKTVSRLNFDQIMDFIIEADPESVNLLFRRPRKETLQARQGVPQKLNAAANKDAPTTVKWVDEDKVGPDMDGRGGGTKQSKERSKRDKKESRRGSGRRSKKSSVSEDEEETIQSSTVGDESYVKSSSRGRKKRSSRRDPYESESFLDLLIDTICANSSNVCRDTFRRSDDDYFSEDDESFVTDGEDESTYVTYDESIDARRHRSRKKQQMDDETMTEDDTRQERSEEDRRKHHHGHTPSSRKQDAEEGRGGKHKYEDDTLETTDTSERAKPEPNGVAAAQPLGLATHHQPVKQPPVVAEPVAQPAPPVLPIVRPQEGGEDEFVNPAPIKEVEYDDRIDHGADVSVMESLGGPSLLIEKQRAAAAGANNPKLVPPEIMEKYGLDYPSGFGMSREQTIQGDPLKYYTYVVKLLLEEHEPEKVRLLDKLLAKYKGREDHLVQKLSVRYDRGPDVPAASNGHDEEGFTDAVKKSKASSNAAAAVHTAKERMQHSQPPVEQHGYAPSEWPEKETKEADIDDEMGEEASESGSDYSRDSVDGTSPAVIAQVSELLNYVYGKTSVPGQIDRVSTIMRAYEGREAVLLELLETKALIKANKEKENADNLPSFLRNSQQHLVQAQKNAEEVGASELPPVTPMATQPVNDDISSMSGVSSPVLERRDPAGNISSTYNADEVEVTHTPNIEIAEDGLESAVVHDGPVSGRSSKPPTSPDKKKKKGLFGGLFGGKKNKQRDGAVTPSASARAGSRSRATRKKG